MHTHPHLATAFASARAADLRSAASGAPARKPARRRRLGLWRPSVVPPATSAVRA